MKLAEITPKTDKELTALIEKCRQDLSGLAVEARTKKLANVKQFKAIKRDIARVLTILREREIATQENKNE